MDSILPQAAAQMRRHVSQFGPLNNQEWEALVPHLSVVTLKKHHCFAEQGFVAQQIGFVIEGLLRQFYTKDGQERTTYFFWKINS